MGSGAGGRLAGLALGGVRVQDPRERGARRLQQDGQRAGRAVDEPEQRGAQLLLAGQVCQRRGAPGIEQVALEEPAPEADPGLPLGIDLLDGLRDRLGDLDRVLGAAPSAGDVAREQLLAGLHPAALERETGQAVAHHAEAHAVRRQRRAQVLGLAHRQAGEGHDHHAFRASELVGELAHDDLVDEVRHGYPSTATRAPGLMVVLTDTLRRKLPLTDGGRRLVRCVRNAVRFCSRSSIENERLPKGACTLPPASVRNSTLPALNSRTAVPTSGVTVPDFGLGIFPWGPRTLPSLPTCFIMSGLAMTMSKSSQPSRMRLASSSDPTSSAPAFRAASALSPSAKTTTRTDLPRPFGRDTAPRTSWSVFFGSMPSRTTTSTVSSNLGAGRALSSPRASRGG